MRGSAAWAMVSSMDVLRQHEISESSQRILNAFDDRRLMLLGEICRLQPGQQVLDLACGKGEMHCRWAERYASVGSASTSARWRRVNAPSNSVSPTESGSS